MSLYKQFKTNSNLETDGIEVKFEEAANKDGTIPTLIIARSGGSNKAYSKCLDTKTRPHRRQMEGKNLKVEIAEAILMDVFIETILKGWKFIFDENGNELAFNKENAKKLLQDLPDVYERCQEEAKDAANFRVSSLEDEAKN